MDSHNLEELRLKMIELEKEDKDEYGYDVEVLRYCAAPITALTRVEKETVQAREQKKFDPKSDEEAIQEAKDMLKLTLTRIGKGQIGWDELKKEVASET